MASVPEIYSSPVQILHKLIFGSDDPHIRTCLIQCLECLSERFDASLVSAARLERPLSCGEQLEALTTLARAALPASARQSVDEALRRVAVNCFGKTRGLDRVRWLGALWLSNPDDMQFYGLFRAACLAGTLSDVNAAYPTLDIPSNDLAAWIVLGRALLVEGRHNDALQVLEILVNGYPDNPVINELYANVLIDAGRETEADAHCCRNAEQFIWPSGLIRLSDDWFESLLTNAADTAPISPRAPVNPNLLLFAISADEGYICRYLARLASSLAGIYGTDGWLLHVHVINPGANANEVIDELRASGIPIACSSERITLPQTETTKVNRIVEARTYYACARLRLLPELLDTYRVPVWLIDVDMVAISDLTAAMVTVEGLRKADVAFIFLEHKGRCLTEKVFLSLSCYWPTPMGRRYARVLRGYIDAMLAAERWGWGLDQAAAFCSLRWLQRNEPDFEVVPLPAEWVANSDTECNQIASACFKSLVGSVNFG